MNENEILDKIKKSAEDVKIPENIKTENALVKTNINSHKNSGKSKLIKIRKICACAAAFVIVASVSALAAGNFIFKQGSDIKSGSNKNENTADGNNDSDSYRTADKDSSNDNYRKVYEAVKKNSKDTSEIMLESKGVELAVAETAKEESAVASDSTEISDYSSTNVQTKNVDEADIVKTDGDYIYKAATTKVYVVDIRTDDMKTVSQIDITKDTHSGTANILEIYTDKNKLYVIASIEENVNENSFDVNYCTQILAYDITDRENISLSGKFSQDGYYYSSRKNGDYLYLFTNETLKLPEGDSDEEIYAMIPKINGTAVEAGCISVNEGSYAFVASSVNVNDMEKAADEFMLLDDAQLYMGSQYLYLYNCDYYQAENTTILRYSLDDGKFKESGSAIISGTITETFAINEYNGKLRVATQNYDKSSGEVFVFDNDFKVAGRLSDIAKGEEIKSARYLGEMLYLVTYRNTDPLFAIDLSNESSPQIVSELKITGFSEYMHIWNQNENKYVLGVGEETDEDSGESKGLKITMFDENNPAEPKVLDSQIINYGDYISSTLFYNYKTILADVSKNLFGFTCTSYEDASQSIRYVLYTFENNKLNKVFEENLDYISDEENIRGLYSGNHFYIVTDTFIQSYDMNNNYSEIKKIDY